MGERRGYNAERNPLWLLAAVPVALAVMVGGLWLGAQLALAVAGLIP